jgi:hypothetical protein
VTEGIEIVLHSLDRELSIYDLVKACRALKPSSIRVDVGGRGKSVLLELKAAGLPARPLQKFRRVLSRDELGTPLFVEGPDDDMAERFDGEWRGQYFITGDETGRRARVYELTEAEPTQGIVTLRWVRVTDPELLKKLRCE